MKMKEQHIVPLSAQAMAIIHEVQGLTGGGRYLFLSMATALHDVFGQVLVYGAGIFVGALFVVGVFFAGSLLLVPLAVLRKGARLEEAPKEAAKPRDKRV